MIYICTPKPLSLSFKLPTYKNKDPNKSEMITNLITRFTPYLHKQALVVYRLCILGA